MKKVYLIKSNDGKYKIGTSKYPIKRLSQLQTGNSEELFLINTYESLNARKIETALHNFYSHTKNMGEWFDLSVLDELNFTQNCQRIDESLKILKKMGNVYV